jgi:hypothetical protein
LTEEAFEFPITRDNDALPIEYRGGPVGRQVWFLQQSGQNLRPKHHQQYVGYFPVAKDWHPYGQNRPPQHRTDDQIRDLRLARCDGAIEHFGVDRARERFTEWPVGIDQLLGLGV